VDEHLYLETLAGEAANGCKKALEKIATLMVPVLLSNARYILKSYSINRHEDAEDVVQDTLIKMVENIHDYKEKNFKAWLFRIQFNVIMTMGRRRKARPKIVGDLENANAISKENVSEITSEINEILEHAKILSEEHYYMFESHIIYKKKLREIAIECNCDLGTVYRSIEKIRKNIIQRFGS
jgi:RNA polymerase sigma factor (sigma-70 family)